MAMVVSGVRAKFPSLLQSCLQSIATMSEAAHAEHSYNYSVIKVVPCSDFHHMLLTRS